MRRSRIPIELDMLPAGLRESPAAVAALAADVGDRASAAGSAATDFVSDLDPSVVIEPVVALVDEAATTTAAVGREAAERARRRPALAAAVLGAALAVVAVVWWRRRTRQADDSALRALDEAA